MATDSRPKLPRWIFVDCFAFAAIGFVAAMATRFEWVAFELIDVVVIGSVFFLSHGLAAIAGEFPRGAENAQIRLGLAAFCRTIVPLIALFSVQHYLIRVLEMKNIFLVAGFYFLSLGLTILSALRISQGTGKS